jgi:hypothetical protein
MSNQPIQFLLHQLATNEQDRVRFNLIFLEFFDKMSEHVTIKDFGQFPKIYQEKIIHTCLSRVNGEAVLRVFEGGLQTVSGEWFEMQLDDCLLEFHNYTKVDKEVVKNATNAVKDLFREYERKNNFDAIFKSKLLLDIFSYHLDNGKPLDEAIQALHDKMLELVPEYVDFINDNK